MVAGVAALLDDQHAQMVEAIWQEFLQRFGVHGLSQTPIPHLTYHVAASYDTGAAIPLLRQIASETSPFVVQTHGLGLFTGPEPVLYIYVRPNPQIIALHRRLWDVLDGRAGMPSLLYHPDNWHPHISLSYRDMGPDLLAQAVALLCQRDFYWQVRVETLSIISAPPGTVHTVEWRVNLGG